jgi:hypothetical protein
MATQFSIPIVNPAFELLKRSGRFLHFIAAVFITVNALHGLNSNEGYKLFCYSQLVIAIELFIMVLLPGFIYSLPMVSLIFRFAEVIILAGTGFLLISNNHIILGAGHLATSIGYGFLFYREWRIYRSENMDIKHTGITIPNFAKDSELSWPEIRTIIFHYHRIIIETLRHKKIEIHLRKGLAMDELQEVDDFCREHMQVA